MEMNYDKFEDLVASKLKDKGNFRVKDYWHSGEECETTAVVVQEVVDGEWSDWPPMVLGLDEVVKLLGADRVVFNDNTVVVSGKGYDTLGNEMRNRTMPKMTDSMKRAKDVCEFLSDFPEDYVESRTSWDELYEQLSDLRWGFEDAMRQLGLDDEEKKTNG